MPQRSLADGVMATTLGWRDVGQVLMSKADAERQRLDENRREDGRDAASCLVTTSRRKPRVLRVDKADVRDREEALAFVTDPGEVFKKRPESRLKWLQTALIHAGKQKLKIGVIYDIVAHPRFVGGVENSVGCKIKANLLANLHLFSSKQQKFFQSDTGQFGPFSVAVASSSAGKLLSGRERSSSPRDGSPPAQVERKEKKSKKKRKRTTSSSLDSDVPRRPNEKASKSRERPMAPSEKQKPTGVRKDLMMKVDPRLLHRGAADEFD